MDKDLLIGLWLVVVALFVVGPWILLTLLGNANKRRHLAELERLLMLRRKNEADRRRRWVAREAMEEARRLKHARRHRRMPGRNFEIENNGY